MPFEAAGLYVILRYLSQGHRLIILAALLFYAAWAFKQSSVTMITGSALALLLLKRWGAFFMLSGLWWFMVIFTLIAGGQVYRENILFSQQHLPILVSLGLTNALRAECKDPFFWLCAAGIIYLVWRNLRHLASKPIEAALALVVSFSFCFALVTSCKTGANDNYYIPAAWAAMLGFALSMERMNSRLALAGLAVCSWLITGAIALTPTGLTFFYDYRNHVLDYRNQDAIHRMFAEKLSHLPGPVFVTEPYANLPWVQRFSPHFVIAETYYYDREAGVQFEDGGWEGLASEGYFGTLVMDPDDSLPPAFLTKYELVDEYKGAMDSYKFYRRIEPLHH